MFMLHLLRCLLTTVHYLPKQEGCSPIKHILPVAARAGEPIRRSEDVTLLLGGTYFSHGGVPLSEELVPAVGKGLVSREHGTDPDKRVG